MSETTKEKAIELISRLPDDVDWEDIMYELYVLENIERGRADARAGRTVSQDEVMKQVTQWLQSAGR